MQKNTVQIRRTMYVLSKDEVEKALLTYAKRSAGASSFGPTTDVALLPDGGARIYTDVAGGPASEPETVEVAPETADV